jgi:hypothetical protein
MENLNYIRAFGASFQKMNSKSFSKNEFKYKILIIYIDEQL